MEMKMETTIMRCIMGLYRGVIGFYGGYIGLGKRRNGKENGNYYNGLYGGLLSGSIPSFLASQRYVLLASEWPKVGAIYRLQGPM